MKKEFLTFVIGVLIGAIIATGVFLVLESNDNDSNDSGMEMRDMGDMEDFDSNMAGEKPNGEGRSFDENEISNSTSEE